MNVTIVHRDATDRYTIDVYDGTHRFCYIPNVDRADAIDALAPFGFSTISARGLLRMARQQGTVTA